MSLFLRDYLTIVWFGLAAILLSGLLLGVAAVVRPSKPSREKLIAYESGVDPVGRDWAQTQVRYLAYAFLYVIFAVDAVYLFPWALVARTHLGPASLVEIGVFIGIILIGLAHAVRRGLLTWT